MSSYVESALTPGEQVVYEGKVSIWSMLPLIVLGFIFLFAWGLGIIFWIWAALRYATTELAITNKRIMAKFGFISRTTIELSMQKTESIQVRQGMLGRIFNYGSIVVSGAGNPAGSCVWHLEPVRVPSRIPRRSRAGNRNYCSSRSSRSIVQQRSPTAADHK